MERYCRSAFVFILFLFCVASRAEGEHSDTTTVPKSTDEKQEAATSDHATGKEVVNLEEVVVYGNRDESAYIPKKTSGLLKLPTEIVETPASIQVVTPQLIEDQDAFRLKDALQNVAGVQMSKTESYGQEYGTSYVRGFTQRLFRSGLNTLGTNTVDMTTVERVEVIKGPDAITYGDAEPGGIVNVVTKGATLTPYRTKITGQIGSYDDYRTTIDTGGKLLENMALRLNASYVDRETFRDYVDQDSYTLAPAFFLEIDDSTTVDLRVSYKYEKRMLDPGVYLDANHNSVASIDTFLGDPATDGREMDDTLVDLTVNHTFCPWLKMRIRGVYHDFSNDMEAIRTKGNPDAANMVTQYYDASNIRIKEYAISNDLIFTLDRDSFTNNLLVGAEIRHLSKNWHKMQDTTTLGKVSITNPVYDFDYSALTIVDGGEDDDDRDAYAVYAQDTLDLLNDRLHLMFGARFDNVDATYYSTAGVRTTGETDGESWQAGVLYELFPHFYPYVSVSTSFNPQGVSRVDVNGNYLDPETGIQYEAGFKSPFFDDRFTITGSVYQIDKEDVAIADPDNPNFRINGGELRSQGFELTAQGDFHPNWSVYASYAYTDTEVMKSDTLPEGARFKEIPLHSGSLWLVRTQHEGRFAGLKLGGGIVAVGKRLGDDDGTYELSDYTTVGLMASYRKELEKGTLTTQVNVHNLFDEEYYESGSGYSLMPGAPRTFTFTVGFEF